MASAQAQRHGHQEIAPRRLPPLVRRLEEAQTFVEQNLVRLLPRPGAVPPQMAEAFQNAVFPGGKRVRPLIVRFVAEHYGRGNSEMVGRFAAALEYIHCASLVHDDLPAFDNADSRRGKPSCHVEFGESTAILVGDALLNLGFEVLAQSPSMHARIAMQLIRLLGNSTRLIISGQGLELESDADLEEYHRRKTGALFVAAAVGGAVAAGVSSAVELERWRRFGELVGQALQLRDDLDDVNGNEAEMGKPKGRDAANARPNAVAKYGETGATNQLRQCLQEASALLDGAADVGEPLRALLYRIGGRYLEATETTK